MDKWNVVDYTLEYYKKEWSSDTRCNTDGAWKKQVYNKAPVVWNVLYRVRKYITSCGKDWKKARMGNVC